MREERQVGVVLQRNAEAADPGAEDFYRIGTLANIVRYITTPDGTHHVVCQGVQRFRILDFLPGTPFPVARIATSPSRTPAPPRSRPASSTCSVRRSKRSSCCRRRRRSW